MIACPECCGGGCVIASDTFDNGNTTGWSTTGTVTESGGLMDMAGASTAIFDTETGGVTDLAAVTTFPLNEDTDAELRLRICYTDANNFLFGQFVKDSGVGTIRLGEVVGGAESWLTDAVTVDDTGAELDARGTLCLSFEPGETQAAESVTTGAHTPTILGASTDWEGPENALEDDDTPAIYSFLGAEASEELAVSGYGFAIPPGSTIDGVVVGIKCRREPLSGVANIFCTFCVLNVDGVASDDKATNEQVSNLGFSVIDYGSPTDTWNSGITWDNVHTLAVVMLFESDGGAVQVGVDTVYVEIHFTTPERQPGTLRFAYTNTGAPQNTNCVTDRSAENPASGRKTGLQVVSGDWDFTTYNLSCTACTCTAEEGEPCACCDPAFPPAASYVADLGAGGWTDTTCNFCDTVAGEYELTNVGSCFWFYDEAIDCPANGGGACYPRRMHMGLSLVSSGSTCKWRFTITASGVCDPADGQFQVAAVYESADLSTDEDCQAMPVTLNKVLDGNSVCGGDLPDPITLEAA